LGKKPHLGILDEPDLDEQLEAILAERQWKLWFLHENLTVLAAYRKVPQVWQRILATYREGYGNKDEHLTDAVDAHLIDEGNPPGKRKQRTRRVDTQTANSLTSDDEDYPYGDAYNALALVKAHGHNLRYCSSLKSWLVWTGTHWQRDTTEVALRLQRHTIMAMGAQLASLNDVEAKALMAHIKSSLNTSKLKAAVEQAKSWIGISLEAEKLDTDIWLLNCANGTLDLRTGTLLPHRQDDLLTKDLATNNFPISCTFGHSAVVPLG
jgi:hypothetical protein